MIFCIGDGNTEKSGEGYHKLNRAWNKDVTERRYKEILSQVNKILSDFKLDAREDWTKEWQKVSAKQWAEIAQIPEFDLEITKRITGLSYIPVEEEKTIEIEGKTFTISELKSLLKKAE